jgi:2-polyprenyl-3-methyl-5-hydroxy-6-metoxy-1,4-benzoquinol methylase
MRNNISSTKTNPKFEINRKVKRAATLLELKLKKLSINNLSISAYNKRYLTDYVNNYQYYIFLYSQLLSKAIAKLNIPLEESTLVDYGGGCGLLSFLAKETGFKTLVYNDIYNVSVQDFPFIAEALGIQITHTVHGDASELVAYMSQHNLHPDLVCSMDVLEHIYSFEKWMQTISAIPSPVSIVFMTSANASNPFVRRKLKKIQLRDEYLGNAKTFGWKERDEVKPFLLARKEIIISFAPEINDDDANKLASTTRGLIKDDIENSVTEFFTNGYLPILPSHPTNTCDPYTGNWSENILSPKQLKSIAEKNGFEFQIEHNFYSYSHSKMLNFLKKMMNITMRLLPKNFLFISPSYTILARK